MKQIMAIAIASALVVPAAMAEVTVYGSLRTFVEAVKITDNGANNMTRFRMVDSSSRLGFKGTDKLDNGLDLYWVAENRLYFGEGNAQQGFSSRDTYVGVKGKYGSAQFGKMSDLTDSVFPSTAVLPILRTNDYAVILGGDSTRLSNAAKYSSPVLGGVQVNALYDFGAKGGTYNYYGYQGSVYYSPSPKYRFGALYKKNNDTNVMGGTNVYGSTAAPYSTAVFAPGAFYKTYRFAGTVKPISGVELAGLWNRSERRNSSAGSVTQQDAWGAGASYNHGKHTYYAQYLQSNDTKFGGQKQNNTGNYILIGEYKYDLSKQTSVSLNVSRVINESNSNYNLDTPNSQIVALNGGAKMTHIGVGVRTDF